MRIDKLLWFLRLSKTRGAAQALVASGHLRRNGARVTRTALECAAGDVLTIPLHGGVRTIEILTIPHRRGPVGEALACYRSLDEPRPAPLAADAQATPLGTPAP